MIDLTKQYRTRDGREVRIYATDASGSYPVHGAVKDGDIWVEYSWFGLHKPHESDLIEVTPRIRIEGWANVYETHDGTPWVWGLYNSKDAATRNGQTVPRLIACVPVTIDCEEGEGL